MPFRRGRKGRRFRGRRRKVGYRNNRKNRLINGGPGGTLAQRLWNAGAPISKVIGQLVRGYAGIRGIINSELHYKDTSFNPTIINTGNITFVTSGLAQGDGVSDRTGNSILLKSIFMRGTINMSSSATTTFVRLLFFLDKENDGATPAVTDVLASADYKSNYNLLQAKRFVALSDKTYTLDVVTGPRAFSWKKLLKPPQTHVKFGGNTGNVADAREGHIFLLAITNESVNFPTAPFFGRVKWFDN